MVQNQNLDKFDIALVAALQENNTVSLRVLADQIHLSIASVQRRIQRLQNSGVIRENVAVADPDKVGKVFTLIVEVHADRTQAIDLEMLKKQFSGPEVQQCYYVTGEADFILILNVDSVVTRMKIIDNRAF